MTQSVAYEELLWQLKIQTIDKRYHSVQKSLYKHTFKGDKFPEWDPGHSQLYYVGTWTLLEFI